MPNVRFYRWITCIVPIAVVGCHSATPQDQMGAAQNDLLSEATALQQCEITNGYSSEHCAAQSAAYERDLAAFRTKYGK
jgi:hypothetical protein